ncbi:MAG: Z1 domain-containing protein [Ruminococcus sp.]|nr:Z1 domain-containing protein [Ruminococcus sp.]
MAVDYEKISNLVRLVDILKKSKENDFDLTEESLKKLVEEAQNILKYALSEEEETEAFKDLFYRYQVKVAPGEVILSDYNQPHWYSDRKDAINPRFWSRYKDYLIDEKNFSPSVISTLGEETLDQNLMNCLGDPEAETSFLKRGLIIGDVQSGKTSTYIGLMCKAADAGYKVFILLTGTIETLRRQTQERVEEGFIGIDMTNSRRVGVGKDNKEIMATSLTSQIKDFTGKSDTIALSLGKNDAVVFVIKKNSSVLRKLTDWLITLNADPITRKIDAPMLLIDDEADNASINTKSKEDPTTINKLIRQLLSVFNKSNYVAFTATPFANVFIDPEKDDDMMNHDLFPEDFIISLPTPSNYIGPNRIFPKNSEFHSQLRYIRDCGNEEDDGYSFYFKHKKDWDDELPESLTDSIYAFYIANAIRDLKGNINSHRTMMINMSRFTDVHFRIKQKVEDIHNTAYTAIKLHIKDTFDNTMKNPVIKRLHKVFENVYSDCDVTWEQVTNTIFKSIADIQIKVVNSSKKSDKLDYPKKDSIRVIAIGGLSLSRGLTLEGLVTSYFYRNTSTYDVLMQMGRWFGYRKNYEDLFRIWTAKSSSDWYAEIAEATDTLKRDMTNMRDQELKPKSFGIRVRNDSNELRITAANKMRNTTDEYEVESYFGSLVETPYLISDTNKQKSNFHNVETLVETSISEDGCIMEKLRGAGEHFVIRRVNKARITALLNKLYISRYSAYFDTTQLFEFISSCTDHVLDLWDVAFMDGTRSDNPEDIVKIHGHDIYKVQRKNCEIDRIDRLKIGQRGKMGGPSDGLMCIENVGEKTAEDIINQAKSDFRKEYSERKPGAVFNDTKQYPSETWFRYISDRRPLLLIYFINVADDVGQSKQIQAFKDEMNGIPATGFAIGFPKSEAAVHSYSKYKVNVKYNYFEQYEAEDEGDDEE